MDSARLGTVVLGSAPVAACFRLRGALRVLAYHGVPDPDAFGHHVHHLARHFTPVAAAEVVAALAGRRSLPRRAVWVTFDDGVPDVVEHGLPALDAYGVPATLFLCASVIDTNEPFWWQTVAAAVAAGLDGGGALGTAPLASSLKRVPDAQRRAVVARLREQLADLGQPVSARQITSAQLERWVGAGHTVGNHTLDHPCLDQCDEAEQRRQIEQADESLARYMGDLRLFAYPNGNWSAGAERVLRDLRYDAALLFDHRLADVRANRYRLSRLRIDSDADPARMRAIVSGAHSTLFSLARRRGGR